jgi:hypothetical protein
MIIRRYRSTSYQIFILFVVDEQPERSRLQLLPYLNYYSVGIDAFVTSTDTGAATGPRKGPLSVSAASRERYVHFDPSTANSSDINRQLVPYHIQPFPRYLSFLECL